MPEFETATKHMSVRDFLANIPSTPEGISVSELLALLHQRGVPKATAQILLLSQLDAGTVRLGARMRLVREVAQQAA